MIPLNLSSLAAALCALPALCSAIVIGNFEGADNLEGWTAPSGQNSTVTLSTATFAATVDSQSLRVNNSSTGDTWGAITKSVVGDAEAIAALTTPGSTITMDVRATGQGVTGSFLNLRLLVNGDNGGSGNNEQMAAQPVTVNNVTQSMTFELTNNARAILANSSSWAFIGFSSESDNTRIWYVDNIQVITPSSEGAPLYAEWLESYPTLDNPDLQSNLYAYAIGADPTDPESTGHHPERISLNDSDDIDYIVYQRSDAQARGLVYTIETTDDLSQGTWTTQGYTEVETVAIDAAFNAVTYRLSTTAPYRFLRLKVEALFSPDQGNGTGGGGGDDPATERLDQYGGLRSLAFDIPNNGLFRTHFHEGQWLIVTPENNAYVPYGLNHFHAAYWQRPNGRQDANRVHWAGVFGGDHWDFQDPSWNNGFYEFIEDISDMVGANSLGYHNEDYLVLQNTRPQLFPYFRQFMPVEFSFHLFPGPDAYPDVFSQDFVNHCHSVAAAQVAPFKDDHMIVGWVMADIPFLTEEFSLDYWGNNYTWAMVLRNLGQNPDGTIPDGKQAYMNFIQDRYSNNFAAFDQVYGVRPQINSWNELRNAANWRPRSVRSNSAEMADQNAFNMLSLDRYYAVAKQAIRGAGANQLFMGDKIQANLYSFNELSLVIETISNHVDVVCYQFFGDDKQYGPLQTNTQNTISAATINATTRPNGLPMLNGDAGFGFLNPPYVNQQTAQWPVADSHAQRATWFKDFAEITFENPHNVGLHICGVIDSYNGPNGGVSKPGIMDPWGVLYDEPDQEIPALKDISDRLYILKGIE